MNSPQLLYPHTKPLFARAFELIVRDIDLVSSYYQNVIGLCVLGKHQSGVILGTATMPLLTLIHDKYARIGSHKSAGLFHSAFLLPSREDLAQFLRYVLDNQIPLDGASDHLVSEALYLSDPEGNGIEVYADRPPAEWEFTKTGVVMDTLPLNADELLKLSTNTAWSQIPNGTVIGHMHLQVGNIEKANDFYSSVLGLKIMARYHGASFFASDDYHHHIAANIWNSKGSTERKPNLTGLSHYELVSTSKSVTESIKGALSNLEMPFRSTGSDISFNDPWGMEVRLVTQSPS